MARLMEERKHLMKNGIYEAAVGILTRHGYEATTMDRVAQEAGVAKGSLYNYFPNKVELLRFVHEKAVEPMRRNAREILATDMPATAKIESMLRAWFMYIDEHRGLFNFVFNDYAVQKVLQRQHGLAQADAVRNLGRVIEQGIEEGAFRKIDANRVAEFLFGAVRQMCDRQLAAKDVGPVREMVKALVDLFLHGVGKGVGQKGVEHER